MILRSKGQLELTRKAICLAQLVEDILKEAQSNPNQILIEAPEIG